MAFANPLLLLKMMVLFAAAGLILLVAHVIWIVQLARSSDVRSCSPSARAVILALAAATPLVSYYVIAAILRARGAEQGRQRVAPGIALAVFAMATTVAIITEYRFDECAMSGARGGYVLALNRSIGAGLAFLVLFMVVRVFAPVSTRQAVVIMTVITLMLLAGMILLLI